MLFLLAKNIRDPIPILHILIITKTILGSTKNSFLLELMLTRVLEI